MTLTGACGPSPGGGTDTDPTGTTVDGTTEGATTEGATTEGITEATSTGTTVDPPEPTTGPSDPTMDETGEPMPVACEVLPADHADACPEPCAITLDVEVRCADGELAAPGLRVAAAPGVTWLVTSSSNDAMLFSFMGDLVIRPEVLPPGWVRETILLALGPTGGLHLVAQHMTFDPEFGSTVQHVAEAAAWAVADVFSTSKGLPPLDLEVDLGGAPHVWFLGDDPDNVTVAVADGDAWEIGAAPGPNGSEWQHFGLTTEDAAYAAGITGNGPWQLRARLDGDDLALGSPVVDEFPLHYRLAAAPRPQTPDSGPAMAAAVQHPEGIRVVWPLGPDADTEMLVSQTSTPKPMCFGEWNEGCPAPCNEQMVGVEEGALAFARTPDGAGWLAYVTTHADREIEYTEECNPEDPGCFCLENVVTDLTVGVLHLVRLDFAAKDAQEVLTLPVRAPALDDLFFGWSFEVHAVDLHAHGTSLAIGLRTQDSVLDGIALRTLRIETDLLP